MYAEIGGIKDYGEGQYVSQDCRLISPRNVVSTFSQKISGTTIFWGVIKLIGEEYYKVVKKGRECQGCWEESNVKKMEYKIMDELGSCGELYTPLIVIT